jgi:hypothetical protein
MDKEKAMLFDARRRGPTGPLLAALMQAQQADEEALAYPRLEALAVSLCDHCDELHSPLVWPVGAAAERLVGASVLTSEGSIRVRGWRDDLRGERVLLATVTAVTPLSLVEAAKHARAMGAIEVHVCGVSVSGLSAELSDVFDSRRVLGEELVPA